MTDQAFDTVEAIVVHEIAQCVIERLEELYHNLLVVYTGALIGADDALDQLAELRLRGYKITLLFSDAACDVHDIQRIERALSPERVYKGMTPVEAARLLREFEIVVVPELSANSCAHIVSCMTDTAAQTVITRALQYGKTVVAAVDGCCPDNKVRAQLGFSPTPALYEKMHQNLVDLKAFGARLCTCSNLVDALSCTTAYVFSELGTSSTKCLIPQHAHKHCASHSVTFSDRLLTAQFVRTLDKGTVLCITAETLVSPLAYDEARLRGILIKKQR